VALVSQQAAVVRQHTDLVVKEYIGADRVDRWSKRRWECEFRHAQVLVMTAQIFLDILQHGFLSEWQAEVCFMRVLSRRKFALFFAT